MASPFSGVYRNSDGLLIDLLTGAQVFDDKELYMVPFNGFFYASDGTIHNIDELSGGGGGGDLTPAQVKLLYESNADTNAFTDAEKTKLAGITPVDPATVHLEEPVATEAELPVDDDFGAMREALDTGIFYIYYEKTNGEGEWEPTGGLTSLADYYKKAEVDQMVANLQAVDNTQNTAITSLGTRVTATETKNTSQDATLLTLNTRIALLESTLTNTPILVPPQGFLYESGDQLFELNYRPRQIDGKWLVTEVLVLEGNQNFYYLRTSDWEIQDTKTLHIINPTLTSGMEVKIVYAR